LDYVADFELTKKQRRLLRNRLPKGKRARTIEDDLTREKLRKILTHCDAKGKALFLFLESSAIRVGEVLQLQLDDIDFQSKPVPKIDVRGEYTKTGNVCRTFLSKEAKSFLLEWLRVREQYLKSSEKRGRGLANKFRDGRGLKPKEDNRIFPFSFSVARDMWNNALKKSGLEKRDKGTNRLTLHIHMLRKYCSSTLKLAGANPVVVERLMGHEVGMSAEYLKIPDATLLEEYMKGEPHLHVFTTEVITELKTGVSGIASEYVKLKNKVRRLETELDELSKFLEEKVVETTQQLFEKWIRDSETGRKLLETWRREQEETDREAMKEEKKLREEKSKILTG